MKIPPLRAGDTKSVECGDQDSVYDKWCIWNSNKNNTDKIMFEVT